MDVGRPAGWSGPRSESGYIWLVTFLSDMNGGNVAAMVAKSSLTGTGAKVTVCVDGRTTTPCQAAPSVQGNELSGTFDLSINLNGAQSITGIKFNETAKEMKSKIEGAVSAAQVAVTRTGPSAQKGYVWDVAFTKPEGNIAEFSPDFTNLQGIGKRVQVRARGCGAHRRGPPPTCSGPRRPPAACTRREWHGRTHGWARHPTRPCSCR